MSLLPKQQKLIKIIVENYGVKGNTKSLGEMMLEAGYSEESSKNPKQIITEEMQEKINPIITKMEEVRLRALNRITDEKLDSASAKDNASIADIMTKNSQLLSGGKTENIGLSNGLSDEEKESLRKLLNDK